MKQTLVIAAHPLSRHLPINHIHEIVEMLKTHNELTIHYLNDEGKIDVELERHLINDAKNILFVFPINWFNVPWNLAKYLSEVLDFDHHLSEKNVYCIVTAGVVQEKYDQKVFGASLDEFLNNFKATISCCNGKFKDVWVYYGANKDTHEEFNNFKNRIEQTYLKVVQEDK